MSLLCHPCIASNPMTSIANVLLSGAHHYALPEHIKRRLGDSKELRDWFWCEASVLSKRSSNKTRSREFVANRVVFATSKAAHLHFTFFHSSQHANRVFVGHIGCQLLECRFSSAPEVNHNARRSKETLKTPDK